MRSIAVGFIAISLLTAAAETAQTQRRAAATQPIKGHMAVGRHQPILAVTEAEQVKSEENGLSKVIEEENERLDRLLKGICRGC
jgi:hypothetical protein